MRLFILAFVLASTYFVVGAQSNATAPPPPPPSNGEWPWQL